MRSLLLDAIHQMKARGLVQSATWASEMLNALPKESGDQINAQLNQNVLEHMQNPTYVLAKSFFDSKQYRRAASTLKTLPTPLARFLRMFATYLDGEKRKEEERHEHDGWQEAINSELDSLRDELSQMSKDSELDAHLWYLYGVVLRHLKLEKEASHALQKSISLFPYNWGAWLELAPLCETRDAVESLAIENSWMKTLFTAHFLNETDAADHARMMYERVLEVVPESLYIKTQLALSLYNMRMFDEAQQLYEDIYSSDENYMDGADIYSNILYVKEDKVQLSMLANRCMKTDKFRLQTCCVVGNYYALRGQHDQALSYFRRALKLNRNYLSAWTLMGHEFMEMKNTSAAVEAYRRAVDINPKDFRAWYGLGQTYELLNMPLYTLYYYQKAASLRPRDARMWCAVGQTLQELRRWDEAIHCYERAVGCDDQEGLALGKLGYLYNRMAQEAQKDGRQHERVGLYTERAAKYYTANLAMRDEEKLGGEETAQALRFLAEYWVLKNDLGKAKEYGMRLLDYPGHDKDFVKTMLRQIHFAEGQQG
ncbi:TPR repeat containing protein [Gracilaria domingensis]|nr:TPR repeat containing protein [Gracilaria domingensis]